MKKIDGKLENEKISSKDTSRVKLGDKDFFGHPKIVP